VHQYPEPWQLPGLTKDGKAEKRELGQHRVRGALTASPDTTCTGWDAADGRLYFRSATVALT
jgi:hypothetical protein